MIAEIFLTAALSAPAVFAVHGNLAIAPKHEIILDVEREKAILAHKESVMQMLLMSSKFMEFTERRRQKTRGRILVIDGMYPGLVQKLRNFGFKAFGLSVSDVIKPGPHHVRGIVPGVPFANQTFYVAYWLAAMIPEDWKLALGDAIRVVEEQGFFIFDDDTVPADWRTLLVQWGWEKLPFKINNYQIWQKPFNGNVASFSAGLTRWTLKKRSGVIVPVGLPKAVLESSA